jgi:D-alanyl-lipoteichoic acid acyltransferase DltB (MBOAT superfamily)
MDWTLSHLSIILPIGLSFHTFQSLSYTIEVYRGNQKAERNLGILALYVMYYPQLVAGPIERPQNLLHQLKEEHVFECQRVTDGLKLMVWGLFKKMVIADRLAVVVDHVYGNGKHSGPQFILATIFFSYQIYCDFSGYSDVAIGAAQVMGVRLKTNFDRPYAARSISEFWRRWHMSLSTWFKDYVYIPLGGNRVSLARWCVSIGIVFLVSGLWHGANYTFLAWGALFGFYMIFGRITKGIREKFVDLVGLNRIPRIHTAFQIITVFLLTGFAWIFFRAKDFDTAMHIIGRMDNGWKPWSHLHEIIPCIKGMGVTLSDFIWCISLIVVLEVVSWMEAGERMRHFMADRPLIMRWAFLIVIIMLILNFSATKQIPFIYFQF